MKSAHGGIKTNMLCWQQGNVKTLVGARGGGKPGGPGPLERAGLEDFLLLLQYSWVFYSSALGSFHVLKVGGLFFFFILFFKFSEFLRNQPLPYNSLLHSVAWKCLSTAILHKRGGFCCCFQCISASKLSARVCFMFDVQALQVVPHGVRQGWSLME